MDTDVVKGLVLVVYLLTFVVWVVGLAIGAAWTSSILLPAAVVGCYLALFYIDEYEDNYQHSGWRRHAVSAVTVAGVVLFCCGITILYIAIAITLHLTLGVPPLLTIIALLALWVVVLS